MPRTKTPANDTTQEAMRLADYHPAARHTRRGRGNKRRVRIVPPPAESKHDRFVRLAERRTDLAIKRVAMIANLAGPTYEYTEDEAKAIIDALDEAEETVRRAFTRRAHGAQSFKLPSHGEEMPV